MLRVSNYLLDFQCYIKIYNKLLVDVKLFSAPITSLHLASECLSQGEQLVSCLVSEGADSVEYSWTLNQQPLEETELLSGHVQANTIVLKQHVSGWLICYAKNHISSHLKGVHISTCGMKNKIGPFNVE